ncbi:unnamed protein product [Chrysoparadoxa australica]
MLGFLRLLALFEALLIVGAAVQVTRVNSNGYTSISLVSQFALAAGGEVQLEVEGATSTAITGSRPRALFILAGEEASKGWFDQWLSTVQSDLPDYTRAVWELVCSSPASARFEVTGNGSWNYTVGISDLYNAYLFICLPQDYFVGTVTTTLINPDPGGELTEHLSINLALLPNIYALACAIWAAGSTVWSIEVFRRRALANEIHYLLTSVLWFKVAQTALVAAFYRDYSQDGSSHGGLRRTAVMLLNAGQVLFLFTLTLLGLGWRYLRQTLHAKEWQGLACVYTLYALLALIEGFCSSGDQCYVYVLMGYIVRIMLMLATIVAINYTVQQVRVVIQLPWTRTVAADYFQLHQFKTFRLLFLAYLVFPTALLVVNIVFLDWEWDWLTYALEEIITIVIYTCIMVTFIPFDKWFLDRAFDTNAPLED